MSDLPQNVGTTSIPGLTNVPPNEEVKLSSINSLSDTEKSLRSTIPPGSQQVLSDNPDQPELKPDEDRIKETNIERIVTDDGVPVVQKTPSSALELIETIHLVTTPDNAALERTSSGIAVPDYPAPGTIHAAEEMGLASIVNDSVAQHHHTETASAQPGPQPQATEAPTANETKEDAEWEVDSSNADSSSSSDSTDSEPSTGQDEEDDYELLNPEEQARILMRGDGGSDDEGGGKDSKANLKGGQLLTKNEKPDEYVQAPDVQVTPEMNIEMLGLVESLVENLVLIKAKTSGEYQVLETGSVLCLENRQVIGVVADTLGRVEQPLYCVRFTNATVIAEAGIQKGTHIFYVEHYSTYVFTQPLKAYKGSDASNLHDEEVGDDEIEFSDDEAEAEHRKKVKMGRQHRKDARSGTSRNPARSGLKDRGRIETTDGLDYEEPSRVHNADSEDDEDSYTPLSRPSNLHEMMSRTEAPFEARSFHGNAARAGRAGRGRGDRGRDGRGGRNRGRGDHRGAVRDQYDRRKDQYRSHLDGSNAPAQSSRKDYDHSREANPMPPSPQYQHGHGSQSAALAPHISPPPYPMQPPHYPPQANQYYPQQPYQHIPRPQSYPLQPYSYPQNITYPNQPLKPPQNLFSPPQPPPTTPGGSIPPGAFINPAFFRNQQKQYSTPPQDQWNPPQQQQPQLLSQWSTPQQRSPTLPPQSQGNGYGYGSGYGYGEGGGGNARMSPESDKAFRAAQEKLDILKGLNGMSRSS
ncbi:MAG: hypothetical protein M1827_006841 [Pycnora praestabilis]|nr:MAG: hypothetical protein M1827_006841 [Pycnora praestabilis]